MLNGHHNWILTQSKQNHKKSNANEKGATFLVLLPNGQQNGWTKFQHSRDQRNEQGKPNPIVSFLGKVL